MDELDLSPLETVSEEVPWTGLDAIVAVGRSNADVASELVHRFIHLYNDGPFAKKNFEVVYLPYVLTELAREGEPDLRRRIIEGLLRTIVQCSEEDDEAAMEYLRNCIQTLPVNDYGAMVLRAMKEFADPMLLLVSMTLWDMLEPVHREGTADLKSAVRDIAMSSLKEIEELEDFSAPGIQWACYRLAELGCIEALPLMMRLEERMRADASTPFDQIDANGVKEAMEILQRKQNPYPPRVRMPLRQMVAEERKSFADWYANQDQPPTNDYISEAEPATRLEESNSFGYPRYEVTQPVRAEPKVGRNDPCPCGSGKKFKKCCGR